MASFVLLVERWILVVLAVLVLVIELWALLNALRYSGEAYRAAGKRTKQFWGLLTALAVVLGVLSLAGSGTGLGGMLLPLIGAVIAGVFLADVLPALRAVMANSRRRRYR